MDAGILAVARRYKKRNTHLSEVITDLITARGKDEVGDLLVKAVEHGQLSEQQALALAKEYNLESQ